jgi:hypothetical protein
VELLDFIITWSVREIGVSTKNNSLYNFLECFLVMVISDNNLIIWLFLGNISFVLLDIDASIDCLSIVENVGNRHSILGESSCLIGADAGGGSKSLDGLQVLDEHHLSSHSLGGKGQGNCDGSEKSLWHVSNNDTNGEDQVSDNVILVENTEDEENNSKCQGYCGNNKDESLDLNRKWSLDSLSR